MFELYTPASFPSPFGMGFDPRDGVYEVVERYANGSLRVASHHKGIRETPAARVAPGFEPKPGERVSGVEEPGVVGPVKPNRQELAYAQSWLDSLTQVGLVIEGFDVHDRLRDRLCAMSFGAAPPRPLRPVLREWLEELVGRYPQDDSWCSGDAAEQARTLLASLGVRGFMAPPPPVAAAKARWTALLPIVDEANRALDAAGSALRWMPCEREVPLSLREAMTDAGQAKVQVPVWLVLVPAMVPALENSGILRRYRGADFPSGPAARDPRVLRARFAPAAPDRKPAARRAQPPEKPCFATVSAVFEDGGGELVAGDGQVFRFARSACRFTPEVGMRAWIVAFVAKADGEYAAAIVHHESDRKLVDAMLETRRAEAREAREHALLARYGLEDPDSWAALAALTQRRRQDLAADLVELKRTSHVFDDMFTGLVTLEPALFHPFLDQLDWRTEPELLAWAGAPYRSVERAVAILAQGTASRLLDPVSIGTIGPGIELARRDRAPRSEVAAAALALAHSGSPEALAALARWVPRSGASVDEVNALIAITGWNFHDGAFHRIWGQRPALRARPDRRGKGRHFVASKVACPSCRAPLLGVFEGAPPELLPFPLFTCAHCALFATYTVAVDRDGTPSPRPPFAPGAAGQTPGPWPSAVAIAFEPAPRAVPFGGEKAFDEVVRVGGVPSWSPIQGPLVCGLRCPDCQIPMAFLAQFTHPLNCNPGLFFIFGCTTCRVAVTAFEKY